jgi:hypothetical protein
VPLCTSLTLTCSARITSVSKCFVAGTTLFLITAFCTCRQSMPMSNPVGSSGLRIRLTAFSTGLTAPRFIVPTCKSAPPGSTSMMRSSVSCSVSLRPMSCCRIPENGRFFHQVLA